MQIPWRGARACCLPSLFSFTKKTREEQRTHAVASIETRLGIAVRWAEEQGHKSGGSGCGGTMTVA